MSETFAIYDHEPDNRLVLVDPIESAEQLNSIAEEVPPEEITSDATRHIITEMLRIAAGKNDEGVAQMVGLAAPQVGISKRIAIVDMAATGMREEQTMAVLINPEIIESSLDLADGREGCWSCGSYCANVPRATGVTVEFYDEMGLLQRKELEGFTARIVQHEVDHLDGIRCIDRAPEDEPWRLHRVDLGNAGEFDRYRTDWQRWKKTFPREEWVRFREGDTYKDL